MAGDVIVHGLSDDHGNPWRGPGAFKEFHASFRKAFPDIVVVVEDAITEGDKVARAVRCAASTPVTCRISPLPKSQWKFTGMVLARVMDGQFVEVWNNFDFMTMYKQLGAK